MSVASLPLLRLRCIITTALTQADLFQSIALLDHEESARHRRFIFPEDRRDYAAAHALLRRMLTTMAPNIAPTKWRFERTPRGKPFLPAELAGVPPVSFSLSHTRGLVACAVSRDGEVGVDAESSSRISDLESLMPRVFSIDEQAQISSVPPPLRADCLLDLWTLKEAYLKARGLGVDVALDQVAFDLRNAGSISASLPETFAKRWWLGIIRPTRGARIGVAAATQDGTAPILDAAIVGAFGRVVPVYPVQTSAPAGPHLGEGML